jgi:hypothetical protein
MIRMMATPVCRALSHVSSMGFLFGDYSSFDYKNTIAVIPGYQCREISFFENINGALFPKNISELKQMITNHPQKNIRGKMGSDILRHKKSLHYISTTKLNKILCMDDDVITVDAGITINDICEYIKEKGRMLAHLPEYLHISIGTCFSTPIHGSSSDQADISELVKSYQYIDRQTLQLHKSTDKNLKSNNIIITQVTLKHVLLYYCEKKIHFTCDSFLNNIKSVKEELNKHYSSSIQWYFKKNQIMLSSINKIPSKNFKRKKMIAKYRHGDLYYFLYKYLLPSYYCDLGYKILAPINLDFNSPFARKFIKNNGHFDAEIKVNIDNFYQIQKFIKKYKNIVYACAIRNTIGDYFWVEIILKKRCLHLLNELSAIGIFHSGKVIPKTYNLNHGSLTK